MEITCKMEYEKLDKGIAAALLYTKRTQAQVANTSAYWIAINAKNEMPYVDTAKIDSELAVVKTPVISKTGRVLKKSTLRGGISAKQRNNSAPLSVLIVMARANPNSNYNVLTGGRYKLDKNPFEGVSRSAGRALMRDIENRTIRSRHSSGRFLRAGWVEPIQTLYPYTAQKFMKGVKPMDDNRSYYGADLGSARLAVPGGGYDCTAMIENKVGTDGANQHNFNRALMQYGEPALKKAVEFEGRKNMEYALGKMGDGLAEEVRKHWQP